MSARSAGTAGEVALGRARAAALRIGAVGALAGAVLAPLALHWLAGRTLVWFDTARLYAPERWLVDDALRSFRLPLWNPFVAAGMPLLADAIHGVLHPVSVVTAWLGTTRSVDVLIGGHVACAGVGAAWLARELGASRAAAALAAFAYGMSGYVLSMAGNLVFLAGAGSLPFCVAGLRRFAAEARADGLAAGAAGAAALALAGDFQALAVGGALALALAWEAGGWRGAARAVAAGTAGLLVAGVQLVPSAVAFHLSDRAVAAYQVSPQVWAFDPWRLPELVLPELLRAPHPLVDPVYAELAGPGHWVSGALPNPFAASVAVGLLPAALALVGAGEGRKGTVLAALAVALLWIAFGPALGASVVLGKIPVWGAFRYSEKLVGPLTLLISSLAALGADRLLEGRVSARRVLLGAGALAVGAIAASYLEVSRIPADLVAEGQGRVLRGGWHVAAAAGALGAWLLARERLGVAARLALPAVVWAAMAAASPAALRPGDPAARLDAPGPALVAPAPGPRVLAPYDYEPLDKATDEDWIDVAGREHAAEAAVAQNVRLRIDALEPYGAFLPGRLIRLRNTFAARWPAAARRYGVTHVVLDPPRSETDRLLHLVATSGGARVEAATGAAEAWVVPHRPWATFPPEVRVAADEDAALQEVLSEFVDDSPRAVVEGVGRLPAGPGRVLSVERGLEALRIEAVTPADSTLVVADAWWPGWEATLDGVPATIFRADALVRAVRWPAGRHVLEMRYRPPEVAAGLLLSLLGIAGVAAGAALLRRRAAAADPGGGRT